MSRTKVVHDAYVEIERRFLIADVSVPDFPEYKETMVEQIFLSSKDPKMDRRLRKEECNGETKYFFVEKYNTSKPVLRFKRKEEISLQRYRTLKRRKDRHREPVRKSRFNFSWKGQQFSIDKYEGPRTDLLILEAVLTEENQRIEIPSFCRVIKEVTDDSYYCYPQAPSQAGSVRKSPALKHAAAFHIVAMIDLLGQGEQLLKFSKIPRTAKEKRGFNKVAQATFGTVERFRDRILLLQRSFSKGQMVPSFVKERLTSKQLALVSGTIRRTIGHQFFTDLAMLNINLSGQRSIRPLISLFGLLYQLGLLILTQLAEGVLLRGAIEVGICAELGRNDLYGQAVARAYTLESQSAVFPRIVVGDSLMDYVNSFATTKATEDERAIIDAYIDLIGLCVGRDQEGVAQLRYLAPVFQKSYFASQDEFVFVVKQACTFLKAASETNERLARVIDYFAGEACWAEPKETFSEQANTLFTPV